MIGDIIFDERPLAIIHNRVDVGISRQGGDRVGSPQEILPVAVHQLGNVARKDEDRLLDPGRHLIWGFQQTMDRGQVLVTKRVKWRA